MEREAFISSESDISPGGLLVRKHYCLGMRRQGKRDYGAYVMPRYDGGTAPDGRKYKDNVWDDIYKLLSENKFDVGGYVEFVFNQARSVAAPQLLKAPELLERYRRELAREDKPQLWEFEDSKILTEINLKSHSIPDPIGVLERVLLDDTICVSPLARYAFGVANGAEFVVRPLEKEAFNQYFARRYFYNRHYMDKVPEQLRRKAEELDASN